MSGDNGQIMLSSIQELHQSAPAYPLTTVRAGVETVSRDEPDTEATTVTPLRTGSGLRIDATAPDTPSKA